MTSDTMRSPASRSPRLPVRFGSPADGSTATNPLDAGISHLAIALGVEQWLAAPVAPPLTDGGTAPGEELYARVLAEYREMPGLSLTVAQAARLWRVAPEISEHVLHSLVELRRLRRTADGRYCAPGDLASARRTPPVSR